MPIFIFKMEKTIEERVRHLLTLEEDWDGYGASKIERNTILKAVENIPLIKRKILEIAKFRLEQEPAINPCPDGSLDLEWRTTDYHILANIPAGSGIPDYSATIKNKKYSGTF